MRFAFGDHSSIRLVIGDGMIYHLSEVQLDNGTTVNGISIRCFEFNQKTQILRERIQWTLPVGDWLTLLNNTRYFFLAIYVESNIFVHDGIP